MSEDAILIDASDAKIRFFCTHVVGKSVLDLGVVQHELENIDNKTWLHRAIRGKAESVVGLDLDQSGVSYLNGLGFDVIHGDAQDFQIEKKFDVVTAGDLIEHLDNPGGMLNSVAHHLSEGGRLILSTPNPFWWKTYLHVLFTGDSRPHYEHTCWFCERTLTQLLQRFNYEVEVIEYGTVYILKSWVQYVTKWVTTLLPLPNRFRHNTIMIVAKKNIT